MRIEVFKPSWVELTPYSLADSKSECIARRTSLTTRHLGKRLNVVGLIDINKAHAENILRMKRADDSITGYDNARVFASIDEAAEALKGDLAPKYVTGHNMMASSINVSADSLSMAFKVHLEEPPSPAPTRISDSTSTSPMRPSLSRSPFPLGQWTSCKR